MSKLSKIILILIIILGLWRGYDFFTEKFGRVDEPENTKQETIVKDEANVKLPEEKPVEEEKQENKIFVYFLSSDNNGNQFLKPVSRTVTNEENQFEYAVKQLLAGPNSSERSAGAYSEIPSGTKLLNITDNSDKIIINFSSNFGIGGGSDSIYSRMRQLIKTVLANTKKPVYLYLDGKQADILGGEGITFSQPLSEKSLDE